MNSHQPDSTISRIVDAATMEFARWGIAGARVERIARAAQTSKERVYAHFEGKQALYRFVAGRELAAMAESVDLDAANLPEYAGRLFDHAVEHPERHRLMLWGLLEDTTDGVSMDDPIEATLQSKISKIRAAQLAGVLDSAFDPGDVLVIVTQVATAWATAGQLDGNAGDQAGWLTDRRRTVVTAVQRLFPTG